MQRLFLALKKYKFFISILFLLILPSILIFTATYNEQKVHLMPFCISSQCVINFARLFDGLIKYLTFSSAIFALFNIYVAVKSYNKSVFNSNFNNHISNYKAFHDYVSSEVKKRGSLDESRFNYFKWYNLIYPDSQAGLIIVSDNYIDQIKQIIGIMEASNIVGRSSSRTHFNHISHQNKIKEACSPLGIELTTLPRSTYTQVENDLIAVIQNVHEAFCNRAKLKAFPERDYL